jgi:hypothetical protein
MLSSPLVRGPFIAWLALSALGCGGVVEKAVGFSSSSGAGGFGGAPPAACAPDVPWSQGFDDVAATPVTSVIVAPDDSVVTTVLWYTGGENDPQSQIVMRDPCGKIVWERDAAARLVAEAFDEHGNVVVAGWSYEVTPILEGTESCAIPGGGEDYGCGLVAKLDPSTGDLVWSRTYMSSTNSEVELDVSGVTPDGLIGVVGQFTYDVDLGGDAPLMDMGGDGAAFAAVLSPDGKAVWMRAIYDANDMLGVLPRSSAVTADGGLVLTGEVQNQLDFGSGVVMSEVTGPGYSVFLAGYGPSGDLVFGEVLGSEAAFDGEVPSVSLDGEGDVFFALQATGQFDLGAGLLGDSGVTAAVLAKLDPAGNPMWSTFAATGGDQIAAFEVTADAAGDAWLAGGTSANLVFDGAPVPYAGHMEPLLLEWSGAGAPVSSRTFPGTGWDVATQVAFGKPGTPVLTGSFGGSIDFGQGELTSSSVDDYSAFVAKLGP